MSDDELRPRRKWPYVVGILAGLLVGLVIFVSVKLRNIDDRVRDWVVVQLQQKFQSDVDLGNCTFGCCPTSVLPAKNCRFDCTIEKICRRCFTSRNFLSTWDGLGF